MKKKLYSVWILIVLVMIPSCGRVIDWGKDNFYQGADKENFSDVVRPFIRSVTIYSQLETEANFDVVWLNDQVRTAYAYLHNIRQGKDEEQLRAFLRRQLEENHHYLTFYVLSTYEIPLTTEKSHWSFFLRLDNQDYLPFEIKEVTLPYEYQIFFGRKWNRFKVPYIIRFHTENQDEVPIITDQTKQISLIARSAQKEHAFIWQLKNEEAKKIIHQKRKVRKKKLPKKRMPYKRIPSKRIRK